MEGGRDVAAKALAEASLEVGERVAAGARAAGAAGVAAHWMSCGVSSCTVGVAAAASFGSSEPSEPTHAGVSDATFADATGVPRPMPNVSTTQRPLFFHHISNCGGTSLASFMERLGHPRTGLYANFNMPNMGGNAWRSAMDPKKDDQHYARCERAAAHARENDLQLVASEAHYPFEPGVCPFFDHIVLICEPIHRLQSRALRLVDANRTVHRLLTRTVIDDPRKKKTLTRLVMPSFAGTPSFDNPMIRQLLGASTFRLPLGAIGEEHYHRAVRRLRNFTLVVPTPAMDDERLARFLWSQYCRLGSSLGSRARSTACWLWSRVHGRMPHLNSKVRQLSDEGATLDADVVKLLRAHNTWDLRLYQYVLDEKASWPPWKMEARTAAVSERHWAGPNANASRSRGKRTPTSRSRALGSGGAFHGEVDWF